MVANGLGGVWHANERRHLHAALAVGVNVGIELFRGGDFAGVGLFGGSVHRLLDLLVHFFELLFGHEAVVQQEHAHVVDGVPGLPRRHHLVARAVDGARVRHGVAVVPVGVHLHVPMR